MKKFSSFVLALVCMAGATAQTWNESTRDAAYTAANSVLTKAGEWTGSYEKDGLQANYIFNANGTVTNILRYRNTPLIELKSTIKRPGTWTRSKTKLAITGNAAKATMEVEGLEQLSERKQDEKKRLINQFLSIFRQQKIEPTTYEILRMDDTQLVLAKYFTYNGQRTYNDLYPAVFTSAIAAQAAAAQKKAAEEKAQKEAEERRIAEEKRLQAIEEAFMGSLDAEKKQSYKRAEAEGVKAVDLGLSVRWASTNLGSSQPGEFGGYYAWGELQPKAIYNKKTYQVATPYKKNQTLEAADDAATAKWGKGWHIPTPMQWQELLEKCSFEEINIPNTGNRGEADVTQWCVKVTGLNGRFIYLPFQGMKDGTSDLYKKGVARYWINSTTTSYKNQAYGVNITSKTLPERYTLIYKLIDDIWSPERYYGCAIRAVFE